MEHISATSLAKAIICSEQFRRRYLLKEPEIFGVDRFIGSLDHAIHAENFKQKITSGEDLDLAWMHGKYRARWDMTIDEKGEPVWRDDSPEDVYAKGLKMLDAYHLSVSPTVNPVLVEQRFEERLSGVSVPIIGYMDIVEETRIIERKTAKQKVSKPKPEWRFQGRIYQLVADLATDFHIVTKQSSPVVYTPENAPELRFEKGNPDVVVQLIQQTVQRIQDLHDRYGPDHPWPTEGIFHPYMCDYCNYKDTGCPAWIVGN